MEEAPFLIIKQWKHNFKGKVLEFPKERLKGMKMKFIKMEEILDLSKVRGEIKEEMKLKREFNIGSLLKIRLGGLKVEKLIEKILRTYLKMMMKIMKMTMMTKKKIKQRISGTLTKMNLLL